MTRTRPIPGYPGCRVAKDGEVYRSHGTHLRTVSQDKRGCVVIPNEKGVFIKRRVSALLFEVWGICPHDMEPAPKESWDAMRLIDPHLDHEQSHEYRKQCRAWMREVAFERERTQEERERRQARYVALLKQHRRNQ